MSLPTGLLENLNEKVLMIPGKSHKRISSIGNINNNDQGITLPNDLFTKRKIPITRDIDFNHCETLTPSFDNLQKKIIFPISSLSYIHKKSGMNTKAQDQSQAQDDDYYFSFNPSPYEHDGGDENGCMGQHKANITKIKTLDSADESIDKRNNNIGEYNLISQISTEALDTQCDLDIASINLYNEYIKNKNNNNNNNNNSIRNNNNYLVQPKDNSENSLLTEPELNEEFLNKPKKFEVNLMKNQNIGKISLNTEKIWSNIHDENQNSHALSLANDPKEDFENIPLISRINFGGLSTERSIVNQSQNGLNSLKNSPIDEKPKDISCKMDELDEKSPTKFEIKDSLYMESRHHQHLSQKDQQQPQQLPSLTINKSTTNIITTHNQGSKSYNFEAYESKEKPFTPLRSREEEIENPKSITLSYSKRLVEPLLALIKNRTYKSNYYYKGLIEPDDDNLINPIDNQFFTNEDLNNSKLPKSLNSSIMIFEEQKREDKRSVAIDGIDIIGNGFNGDKSNNNSIGDNNNNNDGGFNIPLRSKSIEENKFITGSFATSIDDSNIQDMEIQTFIKPNEILTKKEMKLPPLNHNTKNNIRKNAHYKGSNTARELSDKRVPNDLSISVEKKPKRPQHICHNNKIPEKKVNTNECRAMTDRSLYKTSMKCGSMKSFLIQKGDLDNPNTQSPSILNNHDIPLNKVSPEISRKKSSSSSGPQPNKPIVYIKIDNNANASMKMTKNDKMAHGESKQFLKSSSKKRMSDHSIPKVRKGSQNLIEKSPNQNTPHMKLYGVVCRSQKISETNFTKQITSTPTQKIRKCHHHNQSYTKEVITPTKSLSDKENTKISPGSIINQKMAKKSPMGNQMLLKSQKRAVELL